MHQLTTDHLTALLADHEPACISLYQPTHRHSPDNQQDPIRYRDLLRDMEMSLRQKYPTREVRPLLVEADREVPGKIDRMTGQVQPADLADPEVNDLLDDLAEIVLRMQGEVVVVPAERMPSDTGVAATFRY